jgi:hypothetical protein
MKSLTFLDKAVFVMASFVTGFFIGRLILYTWL